MAAATLEKSKTATQSLDTDSPGFGAYGSSANVQAELTAAFDKPPQSKLDGSLDFTDADKRWLKDLGITTTDPNSYHTAWQTDQQKHEFEHRKWSNSYGGRIGMRTFSRGVVGAAFYAAAQMYGGKAMAEYAPDKEKSDNALQFIAKMIDKTAGKAISKTVKVITGSEAKALNAVTFRDTLTKSAYGGKKGQSLGHEAVGVTFDFAAMSFGDYMTRYVIGLMDPNAQKHWMKDGHVDVPGGLKDLMSNVFRGVTYAAGEDMAVAIPYVYGMRLQRHMIEKTSPGFKYDSDRARLGASVKVDSQGKPVGNYELEGMMDLVGRFSWYNVGTKMFRDAYSEVQTKVEHFRDRWKDGDHSLPVPSIDPHDFSVKKMGEAAAHAVRYVARTTVKVMTYMIPAATLFAVLRTPQAKTRALAINPELGVLGRMKEGKFKALKPHSALASDMQNEVPELVFSQDHFNTVPAPSAISPFTADRMDAVKDTYFKNQNVKAPFHNKATNPISNLSEKAADKFNDVIQGVGAKLGVAPHKTAHFARTATFASLAYTPYFMAKTDIIAAEWDTKRMDMGLDRTLSGLGHLNWGEFKAGIAEVMRSTMREPFTDPERERQAQNMRWSSDPEHRSNEAYQLNGASYKHIHTGPGDHSNFATESLKAKKITPETFTKLKTPVSWTEQQALRKFQEADAPSQAIH